MPCGTGDMPYERARVWLAGGSMGCDGGATGFTATGRAARCELARCGDVDMRWTGVERVRGFEIGESTDEPESRGAGSPRRRCLIFFMSFMV